MQSFSSCHVVGRVLVFLALVTFTEPVVTCFFEKKLDPVIPRAVPTLVTTFAGIGKDTSLYESARCAHLVDPARGTCLLDPAHEPTHVCSTLLTLLHPACRASARYTCHPPCSLCTCTRPCSLSFNTSLCVSTQCCSTGYPTLPLTSVLQLPPIYLRIVINQGMVCGV